MMPVEITVDLDGVCEHINRKAPWDFEHESRSTLRSALLSYAREEFEIDYMDAFLISSKAGRVEGVAYVLPYSMNIPQRQTHQVYLKGMLLTEKADDLLPPWAFFVHCVVNAQDLKPTASRESLFLDDTLKSARDALGKSIRTYLLELAENDRDALNHLLAVHYRSIKALAVEDDDFFRIMIDWLPFETSFGRLTLAECRTYNPVIRYSPTYDQFGQIASVAAAQKVCIVNAGYAFDLELIEKLSHVYPDRQVRQVGIDELVESFEDLSKHETRKATEFIRLTNLVLHPYGCSTLVQKFNPAELPSLYTTNESASFLRSIQGSKEMADELWSSVLDSVAERPTASAQAQLTFNYNCRLIQKLVNCVDKNLVGRVVQLLYVQAMILGRHPLRSKETALLSDGLLELIEFALGARGGDDDAES